MPITRQWQRDLNAEEQRAQQEDAAPKHIRLCYVCLVPATVWIRSTSQRFSAPRCTSCGTMTVNHFASKGVEDIDVQPIGAMPLAIGTLDLSQLAREVLDGVVGDHDMIETTTVPRLSAVVVRIAATKLGRPLSAFEAALGVAAARTEFIARRQQLQAQLRETQERLRSNGRMFA